MELHIKWMTTHRFVKIIFSSSLDRYGEEYYIYNTDISCIVFREWNEVHKTRLNIDWTCMLDVTCFTAQNRKKGKEPQKRKACGIKEHYAGNAWFSEMQMNKYVLDTSLPCECLHLCTYKNTQNCWNVAVHSKRLQHTIFQPAWTVQWLFRRSTTTWARSCTIYTHNATRCALTVA